MQEDNVQPSSQFLNMLSKLLKDHKQPVPFTINAEELASNNKAQEFTNSLIELDFDKAKRILKT